ncbi:MAG: lytic transglycosylase domain-containing protein [Clostridia bacterium]|nr:lytic transglycosylase domain-containing protein [Clostridia bacterium]MCI9275319.1 lytic transglycosylase domain-containing protein [Clostridia bacterium]
MEEVDLKNPEKNIQIGVKYFQKLVSYYNGNYYLAITAYNAGIGTVSRWIENGIIKEDGSNIEKVPYKETNNYVRKVLKNYKVYEELYN